MLQHCPPPHAGWALAEQRRIEMEENASLVTVVGGVFCLSGLGLSAFAGLLFVRRQGFLRNSAVAPGVIVALREERDGTEVQTFRYPRIRFRTASGREVTFESAMASGGDRWKVGQTVAVRYRLDDPETAECDNTLARWGPTVLLALLAVVFLGVGSGLLSGVLRP